MRLAILSNSGSSKSTLARRLGAEHGLDVLDLDTVAWEPGLEPVLRPTADAARRVLEFCAAREGWIVEGCYAGLVEATLHLGPELVFLDPGLEVCLAHCRARPWEPHKYPTKAAQDTSPVRGLRRSEASARRAGSPRIRAAPPAPSDPPGGPRRSRFARLAASRIGFPWPPAVAK
ncbi:hypothetical protein [Engelhardtia mirabilis]|uniref:Topology modulation protein n=1 Tax=Engelhardtia mirabilis TaxID=2528011 RepID=A0A518BGH7_9BACT|nr:topology modulation protein [Planctomycetes bacterium Pla133]QDV00393.1 topology modulation protein [Planctomycetes bacterium Pla86]